jgi:hypothetical protein
MRVYRNEKCGEGVEREWRGEIVSNSEVECVTVYVPIISIASAGRFSLSSHSKQAVSRGVSCRSVSRVDPFFRSSASSDRFILRCGVMWCGVVVVLIGLVSCRGGVVLIGLVWCRCGVGVV